MTLVKNALASEQITQVTLIRLASQQQRRVVRCMAAPSTRHLLPPWLDTHGGGGAGG